MLPKAVTDYLAANRQRHLDELFEVLRFPSVSSQASHQADSLACANHLAAMLKGLGFAVELRPWRTRPVLLARSTPAIAPADGPTVLLYGHYDVQPAEPLNLWVSPPYEPAVRDGKIFARGADDNKGQFFAHIKAVESLLKTQGRLPVKVLFLIEGEEEIGSPELETFFRDNAAELKADHALISDTAFYAKDLPAITYGLRGLAYVELTLKGPSSDLHSGLYGGAAVNPLVALARMVARMHDDNGRIMLPGFYDDVLELTAEERRTWQGLPVDEAQYARELGAPPVGGEKGRPLLERLWARPTLEVNGFVGGYQGEGAKTVIPAQATAKISMRLVPNQRPGKAIESLRAFARANCPEGVRAEVTVFSEARPVLIPTDSPAMTAAREALKEAFGHEAVLIRNGASVPITELLQRILGIDPVLMGFGLPDDNLHAPNEKFDLAQYFGGIHASASTLMKLGEPKGPGTWD